MLFVIQPREAATVDTVQVGPIVWADNRKIRLFASMTGMKVWCQLQDGKGKESSVHWIVVTGRLQSRFFCSYYTYEPSVVENWCLASDHYQV